MSIVRVELRTEQPQYAISSGMMLIPAESKPNELTDIINHILDEENFKGSKDDHFKGGKDDHFKVNKDGHFNFIFRVKGRTVKNTIGELLKELECSPEELSIVEYERIKDNPESSEQIPEPDWIRAVAINPTTGTIITGSFDRSVRIYENVHEKEPALLLKKSPHVVTSLNWIDSDSFLAGLADGTIQIWNKAKLDVPEQILYGNSATIQAFAIHDGRIYAADFDGFICVYDTGNKVDDGNYEGQRPPCSRVNKELKDYYNGKGKGKNQSKLTIPSQTASQTIKAHQSTIAELFTLDEGHLVSIGWDGKIKKWKLPQLTLVDTWIAPSPISTAALNLYHDNLIVTGHSDGSLRIWNLSLTSDHGHIIETKLGGHNGWISQVAFDPSNKDSSSRLASAGSDGQLLVWDYRDLSIPIMTFHTNTKPQANQRPAKIICLDWKSPNLLACGGEDKILYIYNPTR